MAFRAGWDIVTIAFIHYFGNTGWNAALNFSSIRSRIIMNISSDNAEMSSIPLNTSRFYVSIAA